MLTPKAEDENRWQPTEIEFILQTMDNVINITISTVIGLLPWASGRGQWPDSAFSHPDLVRGIIPIDAPFPLRAGIAPNDPAGELPFTPFWSKGRLSVLLLLMR